MKNNIKITEANSAKIQKAIEEVQGKRCEARTISASDIIGMVAEAEKHVAKFLPTKADRAGAVYHGGNHGTFPKAYKYTPMGTTFVLKRGTTAWYLVDVSRENCRGNNYYAYTENQQNIISRNAVKKAMGC